MEDPCFPLYSILLYSVLRRHSNISEPKSVCDAEIMNIYALRSGQAGEHKLTYYSVRQMHLCQMDVAQPKDQFILKPKSH